MATFPAGISHSGRNSHCGPFQSSAGDYYAFEMDDAPTVETIMAIKSSTRTGSWTEQDNANAPFGDGDPSSMRVVSCFQENDRIHVAFEDGGFEAFYARFNMGTDLWDILDGGSRRVTGPIIPTEPTIAGFLRFTDIVRRSDGSLVWCFTTSDLVMSIERARSHYAISTDDGESFTNNGDLTGRSASEEGTQNCCQLLVTPADRVHMLFHVGVTVGDTFASTLLDDDTFGAQDTTVSTIEDISFRQTYFGHGVTFDDGGTQRCRMIMGASFKVVSWDDADSPTYSTSFEGDNSPNEFFDTYQIHLVQEPGSSRIWYVYVHGTAPDDRISFAEDPVGDGNFGTEVELADTDFNVEHFSANLIEVNGQCRIGCMVHDFDTQVMQYFESGDLGVCAAPGGGGGGSPRSPLCNSLFGRAGLRSFLCE